MRWGSLNIYMYVQAMNINLKKIFFKNFSLCVNNIFNSKKIALYNLVQRFA